MTKRFEGTVRVNLLEAGRATLWVLIATCSAGRHTDLRYIVSVEHGEYAICELEFSAFISTS